MSKRRRFNRKILGNVGLAVLAVATLGAVGSVAFAPNPEPPVSDQVARYYAEHTAPPKPVKPLDAVFIGDSYTYGYGAPVGQKWSSIVARHYGWAEHNFGFGGTGYKTTATKDRCHLESCPAYPESVSKIAQEIGPDYVIVAGGRNDSISNPTSFAEGVSRTFTDIRQRFPEATILAMNPIAEDEKFVTGKPSVVQAAVESVGGHYIDVGQPVMGKLDLLSSDKVHPNFPGYRAIAEAFIAKCAGDVCKPTPSA